MERADVRKNSTPAAGSGDLLLDVRVLDADHQFFPQKGRKKYLCTALPSTNFVCGYLCTCNPLMLHEKIVSVPPSIHPCNTRTPAHLTGTTVEMHAGPAACSCLNKQDSCTLQQPRRCLVVAPRHRLVFPPMRSKETQGPGCTCQTTATHTKGVGKPHGMRLVTAQATFIVACSPTVHAFI